MNKGFTLIELLAVIIVLGIIFTIIIPKIMNVMDGSEESAFVASTQVMIRAANEYMNTPENTISYPNDGYGSVITIDLLVSSGMIKKADALNNSVVILYNNGGDYEMYAFATDGQYYVDGYKSATVEDHVLTVSTPIDYITETTGITDYTLTAGQLSY